MYMNVLDSLLLALLAMICHLLTISDSPYYLTIRGIEVFTISLIPDVIFWLYLIFKVVFKLWKQLKCYSRIKTLKMKMKMFNAAKYGQQDHRPLIRPTSSTVTIADVCSYATKDS